MYRFVKETIKENDDDSGENKKEENIEKVNMDIGKKENHNHRNNHHNCNDIIIFEENKTKEIDDVDIFAKDK